MSEAALRVETRESAVVERAPHNAQRTTHDGVLILGSGPIVIGQAAEFDYSGTQACLALREAGVRTILVNSNPATIQTDAHVADAVYIEPLTLESLAAIIERERPSGLIATVGGQTALNLAVKLDEMGVLRQYGVDVLGTRLDAIRRGEDRALFSDTLREAGQPTLPSRAVTSVDAALDAAREIGYPVMCRSAFALGGAGSGFATDPDGLARQVAKGLHLSGSGQVLVEKSVYGWTEIEYEVIRDGGGNCLTVCNMENVDPMGVHTGDSIVVAPSQTLSDEEYHLLRAAAMHVVGALRVEGACNVQFALDRETGNYFVIEVNPRLSRSSALASKATGYPIAKVATRIALGQSIPEIRNDITGTSAFFEPALDYVVVKIPRWPFDKFGHIDAVIGTAMRSTGEVMAIGRSFEEAMTKAMRSIDAGAGSESQVGSQSQVRSQSQVASRKSQVGCESQVGSQSQVASPRSQDDDCLTRLLETPNGHRLTAMLAALRAGWTPERVATLTRIHPWFIDRLANIALRQPPDEHPTAKREARTTKNEKRTTKSNYIYKMVDTCAGEFEARTPYFYGSNMDGGMNEAEPLPGPKAIILGSGPIRIGQGIEFDYATVHACQGLSAAGVRSIIVNNNPETVSTDYSTSDRLYFEPLDAEAVAAIVENESGEMLGVIPQFGGQTAINLVQPLHELGIRILGTQPESIDAAEDRAKTSMILGAQGIPIPAWRSIERWEDLPGAVDAVGLPALLRPSYVLSGRGMTLARSPEDVERYLCEHSHMPLSKPLLIDHFLEGATELNVDAVSDGKDVVMVVMEQFEECGVHSGDSAEVYPVQRVGGDAIKTVEICTRILARAFGIVGLMNVQYAVHDGTVHVLEVNPRASRSIPFASKASGIALADLAIRVILGQRLASLYVAPPRTDRVCVKEVVLPFRALSDLTPVLGPEMQSTGESMGMGHTFAAAYWKAELGAGLPALPFGRRVYLSGVDAGGLREEARALLDRLAMVGCSVLAAPDTYDEWGPHCSPGDVDVARLGLAIILGRSPDELSLLRRCVDVGVPYVTTSGGLRALYLALQEGEVTLEPVEITERAREPVAAA
jgi:carbamoyl-phosphate synthase large subunit